MPDPTAFSPIAAARVLLRTARSACLATLDAATAAPFASRVSVATLPDGTPVMLLSRLAAHTRNFLQDPRASLLIDDRSTVAGADALAGHRVTLAGHVVAIAETDGPEAEAIARRRFLARHPEAAGYAGFTDFALYRLQVATAHLVAGFGRINAIAAADLLLDVTGCEPLIATEAEIVDHMNSDHAAATSGYATGLVGAPAAAWRVVGCDPAGLDLTAEIDGRWHDVRLDFPGIVRASGPLRAILKELAENSGKADQPKSI